MDNRTNWAEKWDEREKEMDKHDTKHNKRRTIKVGDRDPDKCDHPLLASTIILRLGNKEYCDHYCTTCGKSIEIYTRDPNKPKKHQKKPNFGTLRVSDILAQKRGDNEPDLPAKLLKKIKKPILNPHKMKVLSEISQKIEQIEKEGWIGSFWLIQPLEWLLGRRNDINGYRLYNDDLNLTRLEKARQMIDEMTYKRRWRLRYFTDPLEWALGERKDFCRYK